MASCSASMLRPNFTSYDGLGVQAQDIVEISIQREDSAAKNRSTPERV